MAFYFALLNVASKREEKQSAKHRRRRHSIASVESPLLDYRLLPRPQIVTESMMIGDESKQRENTSQERPRQQRRRREHGNHRGMRKSESSHNTGRVQQNRSPNRQDVGGRTVNGNTVHPPAPRLEPEAGTSRESHPRNERPRGCPPVKSSPNKRDNLGRGRGRGGRPLVAKRRVSPSYSTTSGSRRSSKESQNSTPHRESPGSSMSSRRESSEQNSNISSSQLAQTTQKLPGLSVARNGKPVENRPSLKKVTFETQTTPLILGNRFLGDHAIVRRASGTPTLLRSTSMAENDRLNNQPYLPILACGVGLWGMSLGERQEETQNLANRSQESADRPLRSCLLRRRSTSDKTRITVAFRNRGFSEESPDLAEKTRLMTLSMDRPEGLTK